MVRIVSRIMLFLLAFPCVLLAILFTLVICIAVSLEDLAYGRNPFRRP